MKIIAHYLPQYHPTPENNEWWGKGFTEWTNVGKAKPLFNGHDQPKVPADLGYYDLRISEVRIEQAKFALEAGVDAFCYWHYWFGDGKQMLEMPFNEVLRTGEPDFPFCLAWANHSWYNKTWKTTSWVSKELLIEQTYPGLQDIDKHFFQILAAFKDSRYFKIKDLPIFYIYDALAMPDVDLFMSRWNELAKQNDLKGIYFIGLASSMAQLDALKKFKFDAVNLSLHDLPFGGGDVTFFARLKRYFKALIVRIPNVIEYGDAIKYFFHPVMKESNVFPTIIPNFDHTSRSGILGRVLHNSTPEKFGRHVDQIMRNIHHKNADNQILFLKSWNEWGEGNYMEPDLKWGKEYIQELAKVKARYSSEKL